MSYSYTPLGDTGLQAVSEYIRELDPAKNPLYSNMDDISCGRLFADVFHGWARYNTTRKNWMTYDPLRGTWRTDEQGTATGKFAMTLQRGLYVYAMDQGETYQKFVVALGSNRRRDTMLRDASKFYPVSDSEMDKNPRFLNCRNVVLDLEHMTTLPHSADLLLTKCTNCDYDMEADSTLWRNFIGEIMENDQEKSGYLQGVCGVALDGGINLKRLFFLHGSKTNNGKSTFLEAFTSALGDYGTAARAETFLDSGSISSGSAANEDVARLAGVRFVATSEPPRRAVLDATTCKLVTGRTRIPARFLFQGSFTYLPQFTILFECNSLPQIRDLTMFNSGRVSVITFDAVFEPGAPGTDPMLLEKLQAPEVQASALNWALEGLRAFHRAGDHLTEPECVRRAVNVFQERSDKLGNFITDALILEPGTNVPAGDVYRTYSLWCQEAGLGVDSKSNFFNDLRERGLLKASGTVSGRTVRNVIPNYRLDVDALGRPRPNPFSA